MGVFEMVVAIVLIASIAKVLQARYSAQRHAPTDPREHAEAQRLRDEVRTLKERVAVLERVITDNNRSLELDREIERLRDNNRV